MKYWKRNDSTRRLKYRCTHFTRLVYLLTVVSLLSTSLPLLTKIDSDVLYYFMPVSTKRSIYYVALTDKNLGIQCDVLQVWRFGDLRIYKCIMTSRDAVEVSKHALGVFMPKENKICLLEKPYTVVQTSLRSNNIADYKQFHRRTNMFLGNGVVVCIIDTGIDYLHPDFFRGNRSVVKCLVSMFYMSNDTHTYLVWIPEVNGSLSDAWELDRYLYAIYGEYAWMDDNGHGTHVAGIVASQGNKGFVGLAPGVDLIVIKAFNVLGVADLDTCLESLEWVYNYTKLFNIKIVNISWGCEGDNRGIDPLSIAIDYISEKLGIIFVCAVGNSGNYPFTVNIPACAHKAVAVGAYDVANNKIAKFSSLGTTNDLRIKPDFLGAGVDIISCKPVTVKCYLEEMYPQIVYNEYYMVLSGTSMATPCVVSVFASYYEKLVETTTVKPSPDILYNYVVSRCIRINEHCKDPISGWGIPVIQ